MNPKVASAITLVVLGVAYAAMLAKGIKPPPMYEQLLVAAAGALIVVKDGEK